VRRSRSYNEEHVEQLFDDAFPNHNCNACDQCIMNFFSQIRLSNVVDLSAILQNPPLHEAIVNLYQGGVQYCSLCTQLLSMRLGIKAAWDGNFRERGFENSFYALDCFTANLEFPRKGDDCTNENTYLGERKRRKVESGTAYPTSQPR